MKQLAVTAAGREVDGTNIIDERFLAESIRNIRGWDVGVLDNSNLSQNSSFENYLKDPNPDFVWRLTPRIAEDIIVGRGMASAYGYDIKSEENVSFSVVRPSTGTKYVFIYLEWDFSDLSVRYGKIDLWDNGSNSEWTPNTADLINNPLGNYQLPLYRIAIDTSGNITGVLNWTGLGRMASKGNAEITQNINGANATALVYRGVMWSKLSDLALESKKARVVIDNKSGSNNEITLASGDKLTNKDGG
ncbi:MAG: hypothetical protein FWD76_02785, partial [Firmicutes bacterium]|nr:hypothetical protein [Bacillota bacterium]